MSHPFFERHRETLDRAVKAIAERGYWSAYPESASPKVYGEGSAEAGKAAFDALLNKPFPLEQPGTVGTVGGETFAVWHAARHHVSEDRSDDAVCGDREGAGRMARGRPGGMGRRLPRDPRPHQQAKLPVRERRDAHDGPGVHDGVPGRRPARAGSRARSRRLRVGRDAPHSGRRRRGRSRRARTSRCEWRSAFASCRAASGSSSAARTFPTWNGFPGFFADLATGNAVVVKPHPAAILPLALTVKIAREVLTEAGFDPNVVTLVAHAAGDDVAQKLALHPDVKVIDFTGSAANGNWLEANARQAQVFTEKSGVNQIVIDSTSDWKGLVRNVAFSLSLYTGQMCTAPQNLYIPKDGIDTPEGHLDVRPGRGRACRRRAEAPRGSGARGRVPGGRGQRRRDETARGGARPRSDRARHADHRAPAVPAGDDPHAAARAPVRRRPRQIPRGMVRSGRVRDRDQGYRREPRASRKTRSRRRARSRSRCIRRART